MRLLTLKLFLKENVDKLVIQKKEYRDSTTGLTYVAVTNWNEIYPVLRECRGYGFLANLVNDIFNMGPALRSADPLTIKQGNISLLEDKLGVIVYSINICLSMLYGFVMDDAENQINIKLAPGMTLEEYGAFISDLNYIFNQSPALKRLNDKNEVTIESVDHGSIWFIIGASAACIAVVAKIAKVALGIRRELIDQEILKQRLKVFSKGADFINSMEQEFSKKIKDMCHNEAKTIIDSLEVQGATKEEINEEINGIGIGVEKMANLMYRGVEVYASLSAPEEIAKAFPVEDDFKQLNELSKQLIVGNQSAGELSE